MDDGGRESSSESSSESPPPPPPFVLAADRTAVESLSDDVSYLWGCRRAGGDGDGVLGAVVVVPAYDEPPSPLQFSKNHVSKSRPCIVRNAVLRRRRGTNCEPLTMTLDDVVDLMTKTDRDNCDDVYITVDATPDGRGDCLRRVVDCDVDGGDAGNQTKSSAIQRTTFFVKPEERKMSLGQFRKALLRTSSRSSPSARRPSKQPGIGRRRRDDDDRRSLLVSSTAAAAGGGGGDPVQLRRSGSWKDRTFPLDRSCYSASDVGTDSSRDNATDADDTGNDNDNDDDEDAASTVYYYSRQNDCLRRELGRLWELGIFPDTFDWAERAFGSDCGGAAADGDGNNAASPSSPTSKLEAVNLWIGPSRAVSAMHKDHYENLYYVLNGRKTFTLCPPADAPFLYERPVESGRFRYRKETGTWSVRQDFDDGGKTQPTKVHWVAADVTERRRGKDGDDDNQDDEFPLLKYAHPITVTVEAGEMLYLPALWYHKVEQQSVPAGSDVDDDDDDRPSPVVDATIAINYWYEMQFDHPLWCYYHFLQQLRAVSV